MDSTIVEWNSCHSSSLLTSFHRAIGQMPRFAVATKFQNVIVSGAQVRFSASSSACFAFNPLRYSNSNALFTSLRKAWLNLDFVWAVALITTAGLTLVFSWF